MNKLNDYIFINICCGALMLASWTYGFAQGYSDWSSPVNLGPTVNSAFGDFGPAVSTDGLSLYFYSTRPGGFGGEDIYVSQRDSRDDPWGQPVNLGPTINTASNERVPAFSRDGHLMFFTSDRPGGFGNLDIWVSRRQYTHDEFAWETPDNLGAGVNSSAIDAGASYFANEEVGIPQLYFGRGVPGAIDIYVSEQMPNGSFGPADLVLELNSSVEDSRPSIRFDGREMVFTSSRTGSVGDSLDLWIATRETVFDVWSEPINVGAAVNSVSNDFQPYLSADRELLVFASNRSGGFGQSDLYMSTRTKVHGNKDVNE